MTFSSLSMPLKKNKKKKIFIIREKLLKMLNRYWINIILKINVVFFIGFTFLFVCSVLFITFAFYLNI